jgi:hypothetical protein
MRNNPPGLISQTFTSVDLYNGVSYPLGNYFAFASSGSYPYNFPLPPIAPGTQNAAGGLTGSTPNVTALARNMVPPLAANYVIGVEHQIPWKLVVGANYSGSRSYDGLTGAQVNDYPGGATIVGKNEVITRLNPNFGAINYVTNDNRVTYNAMILSLRGNPASHLNFQASYTLSHAMDFPEAGTRFDQDGGLGIPDQNAYFSYWGDANWDVRHRFSLSGVYTLPGFSSGFAKVLTAGWSLSGVIVAQTGTPFWVVNASPSGDYNHDGNNYDIPDSASFGCNVSYSRSAYKAGLFTASDFPVPTADTEGTAWVIGLELFHPSGDWTKFSKAPRRSA